jgi:hypothetical protein
VRYRMTRYIFAAFFRVGLGPTVTKRPAHRDLR